ncbi:NAD-dependent epimerase/dehydratase family protein [Mycobacterium vicinigordonae]|uniref:NAD-dependent epimerase/dehydratase family protein n=1 Tax=Mycobacterium vicinigordonae TaxID=1719132 RepID=A0A7D6DV24_9MYCO|nr:NAD-dependent epimerase/dehydratase family protein [Mycobacterium vicinigordonae]QLL05504.1 NAD-dependent epimerase/dehydratase family protein [Mycobacterium vicinigordonae]
MRIAVTGASGVLGRGLAARLVSQGHQVVGLARHRPESWPGAVEFVSGDIRDAATVERCVAAADVVAHCAWVKNPGPERSISDQVNIGGTRNVLAAMAKNGSGRIVFPSSAHVYGWGEAAHAEPDPPAPVSAGGVQQARVEEMLAAADIDSVAIRSALVVGRGVDNSVRRLLALPLFPEGCVDSPLQVVHIDDALRLLTRAVLADGTSSGTVNLAAPGASTFRRIAAALGRPIVPLGDSIAARLRRRLISFSELELVQHAPLVDTSRLSELWGFEPTWNADECIEDLALGMRGRVTVGKRVISLPWRLATILDAPAIDAPADDGVPARLVGPEGLNGEFDTPVDPRFPTFLATNLSEALPGPFSPSSASVTVRGLRTAGVGVAQRLRPGGLIQREIAMRMVAVFAHRLYGAITTAHFMAETMPFVKPATVVSKSGFFGPSMASLPIFGDECPASERRWAQRQLRTVRNIGVVGVNQIGLSAGSLRDTKDFVADVDRLESLAGDDLSRLDSSRLLSLILLARDHVVHGWILASGSFMLCAAFNLVLRGLCGRDTAPLAGPELVSARSVQAVQRLVVAAQCDPDVLRLLAEPGERCAKLANAAPEFYAAVLTELALIGHRGPAELEMLSTSYADDPELLIRIVTRAISAPPAPQSRQPRIPLRAKPVASLFVRQLRDREVRRDKMVRANWVLRGLLREYGRRLTDAGVFENANDVFYLLVDELQEIGALPPDVPALVARRRAEQRKLSAVFPPAVFSGSWQPSITSPELLGNGGVLHGLGVCGGRVRGRVRIVRPETIDDLEPGEILVAEVTDVGYTAAFCYAAAVVTELGGPMSHAAVVAREFGFPCVVDVQGATRLLRSGALVEVDGTTGEIHLLEPGFEDCPPQPACGRIQVSDNDG